MFKSIESVILTIILVATYFTLPFVANAEDSKRFDYKRKDIGEARFGSGPKQEFAENALRFSEEANKSIFGQETATLVLQDRLVQYIEGFPNHKDEPVVLNLIGLPGIGKTAMLKTLEQMKFPIVFFNAQNYVEKPVFDNSGFVMDLYRAVEYRKKDTPLIVVIDELDKLPEISGKGDDEKTHTLIGALNSAISEGRVPFSSRTNGIDVSNVMFITTMNFSPKEIETFTGQVLGSQKSFYDMTIDDFVLFDKWIREQPSARYKVLSQLFRSNTVSRLAPNTVILQPLSLEVYRHIIELVAQGAIDGAKSEKAQAKQIEIEIDKSLIDFMLEYTVFAPSGARETVFRAKSLIDQLVTYGMKSTDPKIERSTDRPRKIELRVVAGQAVIKVTPLISKNGEREESEPFDLTVKYDTGARLFLPPDSLTKVKPIYPKPKVAPELLPVTKKEVRESRFSALADIPKATFDSIDNIVLGQTETLNLLMDDFKKYLGRQGPAKKEPSMRVLSGFPGIGKSELVKQVASHLKLPVVKMNMQQFSSDSPETVKEFLNTLEQAIDDVTGGDINKKYILLFEELDKVFEVNPQTGMVQNRPIMALIKDILNEGRVQETNNGKTSSSRIDVRSAFTFVTMNFSVDRFGFSADPRLTSIDDVTNAWRSLISSPMALKQILGTMFLPETVSRMLSRFTVMKPLGEDSYRKLIELQIKNVVDARMLDQKGRNVAKIDIKLSDAYKQYLYSETVIPSEGARHTVVSVQSKISSHVEAVLQGLPRESAYASSPLEIELDFDHEKSEVLARIRVLGKTVLPEAKEAWRRPVALQFPNPKIDGAIPAFRMFVSAHEFGHAYMATRLGMRFSHVVVVPPDENTGGYVKFVGDKFLAKNQISYIYSALAARAMERIVMTNDPQNPLSVLEISTGPSGDIRQATYALYNILYELGLDPDGGTIDSNFNISSSRYASIAVMPQDLTSKLALILRDIENLIVSDFLSAHDKPWYVDRIVKLAKEGVMKENEFYDLVEYEKLNAVSGEINIFSEEFLKLFGKHLTSHSKNTSDALSKINVGQKLSVNEIREKYAQAFAAIVKARLHDGGPTPPSSGTCAKSLKP